MKDITPGVELPNNQKPKNYPQDFVVSNKYPNTYNNPSKKSPSPQEILKDMV